MFGIKRQLAFTLIELLSAVAIVAVLVALVVPAIQAARIRALGAMSGNNLKQLVLANVAYAADHGTFAPAADQANLRRWHGARLSETSPFDPTKGFLADYLGKSRRVIACPLFQILRGKWSKDTFEDGSGGFGYNEVYLGGMRYYQLDSAGVFVPPPVTQFSRPASTLMFGTTAYANGEGIQEYPFCEPPFWDFGGGPSEYRPSPSLHFRFTGKAIVGWCDGHVSFESEDDREDGWNPHGGDAEDHRLGWFGPDSNNGFWNPEKL